MVSLCLAVKDLSENDSKKDVGSLYFDVICDSIAKKEISSAALVLDESLDSLFYDANEDIESSFRNDHKQGYRLLWVPLSRAYDMETPFVSPSEMTMIEEKREENIVFEEEIEDENLLATENKPAEVKMYQDENLMATERESVEKKGSLEVAGKDDEKYKDVGYLYCEEICESVARKEISSAALVLDESIDSLFYDAKDDILRHTTVQGVILGTKCSNMMNITRALNIFLFNKNCQT
ncbi:hypothetical protein SADUNF_Sadunf17G0077800 [Salix dunnii]|uniref:Uncharacterized protein n=1 Tax=Salix dunnii TaxID=1413687 RepID=A0A835J6F3_9ROSI|nr:hypothetical protein SADUNF_Sadunf17G0077800 [Salix dunnii]